MPRGVYDRTKKKGDAAPAKKAPVAKAAPAKAKAKTLTEAGELNKSISSIPPAPHDYGRAAEASFGFQILGANLSTLAEAHKQLSGGTSLHALISTEIEKTILTLSALRRNVFRDLLAVEPVSVASVTEGSEADVQEEEVPAPAAPAPIVPTAIAAPIAAPLPVPPPAPTLPQGNSGYTPPAPPTLPHH